MGVDYPSSDVRVAWRLVKALLDCRTTAVTLTESKTAFPKDVQSVLPLRCLE